MGSGRLRLLPLAKGALLLRVDDACAAQAKHKPISMNHRQDRYSAFCNASVPSATGNGDVASSGFDTNLFVFKQFIKDLGDLLLLETGHLFPMRHLRF
jgi:hypothetical protein